ncbi:hypothetical protein OpiT1DRAFT_05997 [Opitutaceae bacterium TAV1]|nr:hypothetical protein OpiT1DRAFT_05997 [Opitutaceae bacterium TAV1]
MVDCWLSDTATPVVTEFNLDAIRANRNQFDYDAVKKESGWITFQDDREMLRFRIISSNQEGSVVEYQENGGGTLTTQRTIRFIFCPRSFDVDGQKITVTVLRIISIL